MATFLPNITDVIPEPALFTPNFSFLDTMLRRRQGLYEQGFAQVNSAYNFVNRSVTNPYSVQVRDTFLKQAKDNLKNLSALDLSQQQNVKAASSVFDPFVKNRAVLGDMALTAHWDQQEGIAESFRLKDGGKEYSDENVGVIRQQRQAFANDDISTVNSYYANRESYTPYYDYNKEVNEGMKFFKPSTYKIARINGLYKMTKDDKSWREAEVAEYLTGILSEKAKKQLSIEAQFRLGNNPQALASAYKQVAAEKLEMNKYTIDLIDKQLLTTKDKAAITKLKTRRQDIEDGNREIDGHLQNLAKGDLSYVKSNSKSLANTIYFNSKLSGYVKAYAHDDITIDIDADQVGIALMKEARADARQQRAFDNAKELKMLELEGLPGNFQTRELPIDEKNDTIEKSIKGLQTEIDLNETKIQEATAAVKNHILSKVKERDPNSKITIKDIDQSFISNWLKTGGPGGKRVLETDPYYTKNAEMARYNAIQNTARNQLDKIDAAAMQGMTAAEKRSLEQYNQKVASIGTIRLEDGSTITGKDFAAGIKNGTISATTLGNVGVVKINGKSQYMAGTVLPIGGGIPLPLFKNMSLLNAYKQIKEAQDKAGDSYDKALKNRETYLKDNFANIDLSTKVVTFDAGSPNAKSLESTASSLIPNAGLEFQHAGVGATANNQGNAYFYITPKGNDSRTPDQIVAELTAGGAKVKLIKTKKGPAIYELEGLNNRVTNQFRQYSPLEGAVINEMQTYGGVRDYQSAPFTTPYGNTKFIIKKSGNFYYLHVNGLGETYPDVFTSPIEAVGMARLLSAKGGAGANMFMNEVSNSNTQTIDMSGMDYDYRYE
jgi:hypothetical protein